GRNLLRDGELRLLPLSRLRRLHAPAAAPEAERVADALRELLRARAARRLELERAVDEGEQRFRQVGPRATERRRAALDRLRRLDQRRRPERMEAGERLPQQHADGPDVRGRAAVGAIQ